MVVLFNLKTDTKFFCFINLMGSHLCYILIYFYLLLLIRLPLDRANCDTLVLDECSQAPVCFPNCTYRVTCGRLMTANLRVKWWSKATACKEIKSGSHEWTLFFKTTGYCNVHYLLLFLIVIPSSVQQCTSSWALYVTNLLVTSMTVIFKLIGDMLILLLFWLRRVYGIKGMDVRSCVLTYGLQRGGILRTQQWVLRDHINIHSMPFVFVFIFVFASSDDCAGCMSNSESSGVSLTYYYLFIYLLRSSTYKLCVYYYCSAIYCCRSVIFGTKCESSEVNLECYLSFFFPFLFISYLGTLDRNLTMSQPHLVHKTLV